MITFKPGEHLPVAFDIDGIFLDTATEMWRVITTHLNSTLPIDRWTHYDIGEIFGVPTHTLRTIYEPVLEDSALRPVDGAVEALQKLYKAYKRPILFVTARRAQFKQPAINSIELALGSSVEFEVLCTGDIYEDEFRNDKLDLLKEYKIQMFVEDNYFYWEKYIDAHIDIATLWWPWTTQHFSELSHCGKSLTMCANWHGLYLHLNKWLLDQQTN